MYYIIVDPSPKVYMCVYIRSPEDDFVSFASKSSNLNTVLSKLSTISDVGVFFLKGNSPVVKSSGML